MIRSNQSLLKKGDLKNDNNKNKFKNFLILSDLVNMAEKDKEMELKYDLERNVKLINFDNGKIK